MSKDITIRDIQDKIVNLPNRPPVMLANDMAELYETEIGHLNRAVKRNPDRFPEDFCFKLTESEWTNLKCQNGISSLGEAHLKSQNVTSSWGGARHAPWAFTRMGANMLSTVLKTPIAAQRSVQIMRAFSAFEERAMRAPDILEQLFGPIGGGWKSTPKPEPVIPPDAVLVPKDRFIELLQAENSHLKDLLGKSTGKRDPKPQAQGDLDLPYFRKSFTQEEKELIVSLYADGVRPSEIAKRLGRARGSITSLISSRRMAVN